MTVLLASAVPDKTGLLLAEAPVGPVRVGAAGGVASSVKIIAGAAADEIPAPFTAFAVIE